MVVAFIVLLVLALAFGGVAIAGGLSWLLILAAVLLVASFFTAYRGSYTGREHHHR